MSSSDEALERLSVKELQDLRVRVDRWLATRHADDRNALREQFRKAAEAAGFTLAEVVGSARGGKGRPAQPKYANPDDPSETWAGRGRLPRWLSARLKSGAKIDDFKI